LSPAQVWLGVKNSDDAGLRVDLLAEVFVNSTAVGQGQVTNVSPRVSGFNAAVLNSIAFGPISPVSLNPGDALKLKLSVRRTCSGAGRPAGTATLWYNGQPIDSGPSRDAGTRFDATIGASTSNYYARGGFQLDKTAGSSKLSIDKFVDNSAPCPNRPFTEFGTWSMTQP